MSYWMNSRPVAISKRIPPTSITSEILSSTWAIERAGGHLNSRGITDHSLAITTGISIRPSPTCTPCDSLYSQGGRDGQSNAGSFSQPTCAGSACPNWGEYAMYDNSPVMITIGNPISSTAPNTDVNQGPRS